MSIKFGSRKKFLSYILFDSLDDQNLRNVEYLLAVKRSNPNEYLQDLDLCPMHCAVGTGNESFALEATSMCLRYGGDPNVRNSEGTTPVHVAAWWGRRRVAELLLDHGGDPFIKDNDGSTALDLALANNQQHLYSKFVVHYWSQANRSGEGSHRTSFVEERPIFKEKWPSGNECTTNVSETSSTNTNVCDDVSYTDIDSEVNFVEVFVPNRPLLQSSSLDSLPSMNHYLTDVTDFKNGRQLFLSNSLDRVPSIKCSDMSDLHCSRFYGEGLSRCSSAQSIPSVKSEGSTKSWATEYVRAELKRMNLFYGPIVKSTKRLYVRQLKRLKMNPEEADLLKQNDDGLNEFLTSTFGSRLPELISKWSPLLDEMIQSCAAQPGRGSKERCFFTYILLDPLITCNLPVRMINLNQWEAWTIFIKSIFYIGKGKNSRPMSHLYDAIKVTGPHISDKIKRIRYIWSVGAGVVCVQAFHSLTEPEAYNREAAMIEALRGYPKLTNRQAGEYSGKIKYWSMKDKKKLGILLLYRAMQIYVADNERQIYPGDLKSL